MDLHIQLVSPPARAAYVTAKHLGLDFNVKLVNVIAGENKTPEYLKMNPSHTIPTLNDNGFFLFESRAIMTYLVNQYRPDSPLYPKDPKKRAEVDKVLYFDASAVFPALINVVRPKLFQNKDPTQEAVDTLTERISILEQLLGKKKFFTGDQVTLADISVDTNLYMLITREFVPVPATLIAWHERVNDAIPELRQANQESIEASKRLMEALSKHQQQQEQQQ